LWGFVKNRLLSFAMVIGIGFLLLVSLVISAALSATAKYFTALVPGMDVFWHLVNIVLSFLVITVLFAMIYKILPDVQISWGDVWVGSAVTALLFTIGKFLLGLYLGRNTTVSAYGAAGSVVLILLWVYYSAQILFFGAEVTQAYANRYGVGLQPKPNARWINPVKAAQLSKAVPATQPAPTDEPDIQLDPEKKLQLISELREEVESLRHLVRTGSTRS
jgi:membrane protein